MPLKWITSGPHCAEAPDWQVHEYNEDLYILRQSGCTHYEKPFLYLFFGTDKALLMDTGAGENDVARVVTKLVDHWLKRKKRTGPMPLVVMHSHAHGDHTAGDKQFQPLPHVTLVAAKADVIAQAFGLKDNAGAIDLGSRVLDILAIPGHEAASVAVYDRKTGVLLTGDTLYPGRLYIQDWAAYVASAKRLVEFTQDKPVTHVLGAHIEQSRQPFTDYPRGTVYHPDEHELSLGRSHLLEWHDALQKAGNTPAVIPLRDFTIMPRMPTRRQ